MKTWQFALCLPLVVAGCSSKTTTHAKSAERPVVVKTVTRTVTDVQRTGLEVAPEIAKVCALPDAHFDFDSAEIKGDAAAALDKLADCFTSGALSGRKMKIIGHADPRGAPDYNLALGQRRAGAVADYLGKKGLPEGRMETASMGALDAKGTDEAGWAKDRKVEILLGEEAVVVAPNQPVQRTGGTI